MSIFDFFQHDFDSPRRNPLKYTQDITNTYEYHEILKTEISKGTITIS